MLTVSLSEGDQENKKSGLLDSKFDELIDAWEMARSAYEKVLAAGVNRSDIALAHDKNYNCLLMAGQKIFRLGGAPAVSSVAHRLGNISIEASARHFDRLRQGLIPEKTGRAN